MVIAVDPAHLAPAFPNGTRRMDPGRLLQGLMTGVGFLGDGVIVKEGVRAELKIPRQVYAIASFRFEAAQAPSQDERRDWLKARGVRLTHISYRKLDAGCHREFSGTLQARREADFERLDLDLHHRVGLIEYNFTRNNK